MPSFIVTNSVQYTLGVEFTTGSFTTITEDLKRFNCARDIATIGRPIKIGKADFTLDNQARNYSPTNSSGLYYGDLTVGTAIKLEATYQNSTRSIFTGVIQNININPVLGSRVANISAIDAIDKLKKADVRLSLLKDTNAASLFSHVMSIAGITQTITSELLAENIPFVGTSSNKASKIIQNILELGHYYFHSDGSNDLYLKNRHFNVSESPVASLNEFYSFDYNNDIGSIKNYVKVKSSAKKLDTVVSTIAFTSFPQTLPASGWITFYIDYINPYNITQRTEATSVSAPAPDTDWIVTPNFDGTGSLYTSACSLYVGAFGDSAICSLYNGLGVEAHLTTFNIKGYSIYPVSNVSTIRESTASQNTYGVRSDLTIDSEYIESIDYTAPYAEYLRDKYKDPDDDISLSLNSIFPQVLDIDISNLIHVVEDESSSDGEFRVMSVEHDIDLSNGGEHILSVDLEQADQSDYLQLDDATNGKLDTAGNILLF